MLSFLKNIGILEICLVQFIFYSIFWLTNEYLATLLTTIMVPMLLAILIISLIAEFIDKSKVPRSYFKVMAVSVVIPLIVAFVFVSLFGGHLEWVTEMSD